MTRDELDRTSAWLDGRADKMEQEEPYAVDTISALRDVATLVALEDPDDE